jgi:hypothetical protein
VHTGPAEQEITEEEPRPQHTVDTDSVQCVVSGDGDYFVVKRRKALRLLIAPQADDIEEPFMNGENSLVDLSCTGPVRRDVAGWTTFFDQEITDPAQCVHDVAGGALPVRRAVHPGWVPVAQRREGVQFVAGPPPTDHLGLVARPRVEQLLIELAEHGPRLPDPNLPTTEDRSPVVAPDGGM